MRNTILLWHCCPFVCPSVRLSVCPSITRCHWLFFLSPDWISTVRDGFTWMRLICSGVKERPKQFRSVYVDVATNNVNVNRADRVPAQRDESFVFGGLPEPNRACLVGVYAFLIWNNLCDLVYQTPTKSYRSQIPVAFGIPGHMTTKHLPDTPC